MSKKNKIGILTRAVTAFKFYYFPLFLDLSTNRKKVGGKFLVAGNWEVKLVFLLSVLIIKGNR